MKKYKINATETITYEFVIEAKDFEDACASWHNKFDVQVSVGDDDPKEIEDRVWETQSVKEVA